MQKEPLALTLEAASNENIFFKPMLTDGIGEAAAIWFWMKMILPAKDHKAFMGFKQKVQLNAGLTHNKNCGSGLLATRLLFTGNVPWEQI